MLQAFKVAFGVVAGYFAAIIAVVLVVVFAVVCVCALLAAWDQFVWWRLRRARIKANRKAASTPVGNTRG